jgi:hypothetical protein
LVIPPEGNGKNWKKIQFWNLKIGHTTRGKLKKLKYVTKIWNGKIWKFSFSKFEMKKFEIFHFELLTEDFRLKIEFFFGHITRGKWKKLKWINLIFRLYHRDKTSNNTPIPPMYTTLYHRCKLWCYTINLSRRILSYRSFSNSGVGW